MDIYDNLTVHYINGHNPDLVILDTDGNLIERVDLIAYKTFDDLHALLKKKGFTSNDLLRNSHTDCHDWAEKGECELNEAFMQQTCAKACARDIVDTDDSCAGWAGKGECKTNHKYMRAHCAKTCKALDKIEL